MAYEIIDIVNERDEVVGQVERTPEWDKLRPTPYRFINILIRRRDGHFVLQQRSHKKNNNPLRYGASVGGLLSQGEDYLEAAQREMQEELGIDVPLKEVGKVVLTKDDKLVSHCMLYEAVYDGEFTGWEEEAERLEFMTLDELKFMTQRFPYLFTRNLVQAVATLYGHESVD